MEDHPVPELLHELSVGDLAVTSKVLGGLVCPSGLGLAVVGVDASDAGPAAVALDLFAG
jgi:hypothetical protein